MHLQYSKQGQMGTALCHFYTDTIQNFNPLLANDEYKQICIDSWKYITQHKLITIYGYVIMPNHIHLLWMMNDLNGKENPAGSFAKFTAHRFKKLLTMKDPVALQNYHSKKTDRAFQF